MSVTITHNTDKFYIQTLSAWTITPSNINTYLSATFTPKITRNSASTSRTEYFAFIATDGGSHSVPLTTFAASFAMNTTAKVSVFRNNYKAGRIANQLAINGVKLNKIKVELQTASGVVLASSEAASYSLAFSGFTPNTPTISNTLSQTTPQSAQFGYVKGFASASWSASVTAKTWTFTDTSTQTINPAQTLTLTANGATASSGSGTGTRSASLAAKTVNATSLTGTASVSNVLGGTASKTSTATVQDYIKPSLSALTATRTTDNHAEVSFNWSASELNKANSAVDPCRFGTITAAYSISDNDDSTVVATGTKTIIADGETMAATNDSFTFTDATTYAANKSYTVAVTLTDRLTQTSQTMTAILATEFHTIDFLAGGKGVAIGKTATREAFDVSMPMYLQDTPVADWVTEQGTNGAWKYRKWYSGKVEAWYHWSLGDVDITTASPSYGGYRSLEITTTIPSGIFTAAPFVVAAKTYSQGGWLANIQGKSATQIGVLYGSGASATIHNQTIDVYAWQN